MTGGWHDDVVDMMVGMLSVTMVRNSEVLQVNFLQSNVSLSDFFDHLFLFQCPILVCQTYFIHLLSIQVACHLFCHYFFCPVSLRFDTTHGVAHFLSLRKHFSLAVLSVFCP